MHCNTYTVSCHELLLCLQHPGGDTTLMKFAGKCCLCLLIS